jgi:hypothetical protein
MSIRRFLTFALGSALLLTACASQRVDAVCYGNGAPVTAIQVHCQHAAGVVLSRVSVPVERAAIEVWRGCFPGAYCPLLAQTDFSFHAAVAIRFTDGSSRLFAVDNLQERFAHVGVMGGIDPDRFLETLIHTRGSLMVSVAIPSST